jgi:hypothetical protein
VWPEAYGLQRYLLVAFHIKLAVKGMAIFFNILGRVHSKQLIELGPEIFDITDANFKRGLVHITIVFKHQLRRFP